MSSENLSPHQRLLITVAVMSATLMQVLDTTIVNVALPDMQGNFGATSDQISWVLTSYLVASAICMPLTGYFSDIWGRKRYLMFGIVGFTITSALCGIAENIGMMVFFRVLQGVFGAALVPLSQAILTDIYPIEQRGKAMAIWGTGITVGPILGPTLGGYLTEYFSWRWNFYINLPVGIFACFLVWRVLPQSLGRSRLLDWPAFLLLSLGIGCLQFLLDRGNQEDWLQSVLIRWVCFGALVGFGGFFIRYFHNKVNPLFHLEVFKDRNFLTASLIMAVMGIGMYGSMTLQPIMLDTLFQYPAFVVGLLMAPRGLASMFGMSVAGKLMTKFSPATMIGFGIFLNALGTYGCTQYSLEMNHFAIIAPGLLQGIGLGFIYVPLSVVALATVDKRYLAEAAGLYSLMRTIGASAGISVVITYYTRHGQIHWNLLGGFINEYSQALKDYVFILGGSLNTAIPLLAKELFLQSQMMAALDTYSMMMTVFVLILPLLLLFQVNKLEADSEAPIME